MFTFSAQCVTALTQNVVLRSILRRLNVMDVRWTLKQRYVYVYCHTQEVDFFTLFKRYGR